jgi:anti-sigma regulatory factor (Ser/Thr protein kinase)
MEERITISNRVEELATLAGRIEELAEQWELPMPLTMNLNLVLEEIVSNIIFYAYPNGGEHFICITLSMAHGDITIEIEDDGIPFDPTTMQQPDINLPAEDRPIGGLGIFLVSKIMDNVSYTREQEKNKLTLKKKTEL